MSISSYAEHREQTRVSCALAVQVHAPAEDVLLFTYAMNISHRGVYVRANRPLPQGASVSLDLQPSTPTERLTVKGVVVRVVDQEGSPRGMGIVFSEMCSNECEALERLVSRLDNRAMLTVADAETYSRYSNGDISSF
ncbi:MAG: PilZ domain-containing protein [Deltaproteobacteria bacterium]|nr:PilZ domain-containing protein [Deltaproteobacteria bacterium]